jgi:hypothetical protein
MVHFREYFIRLADEYSDLDELLLYCPLAPGRWTYRRQRPVARNYDRFGRRSLSVLLHSANQGKGSAKKGKGEDRKIRIIYLTKFSKINPSANLLC